uniref:ubiquitinyl hydrolase 1 n=1 Tax=Knipowitschia caucasica TaxID=637954 RepID=A0AAV2M1N9_KNICA
MNEEVLTDTGWMNEEVLTDTGWMNEEVLTDTGWMNEEVLTDTGWMNEEVLTDTGWMNEEVLTDTGWMNEEVLTDTGWMKEEVLTDTGWMNEEVLTDTGWMNEEVLTDTGWMNEEVLTDTGWMNEEVLTDTGWMNEEVLTDTGWMNEEVPLCTEDQMEFVLFKELMKTSHFPSGNTTHEEGNRRIRACDCDPAGSLDGGLCDPNTDPSLGQVAGQCRCKANVEGARCDRCKSGFHGLSADDPHGCQPCRCDPRGSVPGRAQCDPLTGDCVCKRLVTGSSCNQCLPEHWALSHDLSGCRGCDCDVGGALDNMCSMDSGQCSCRSHMTSRQCSQVQSGFFFAALDHLLYEAESATLGQGSSVEVREHSPGRPASWTGVGFARVPVSSTLEFSINNIPFSMEYELLLRYESQMPRDWEEVRVTVVRPGSIPTSSPCGNTIPDDDRLLLSLPATARFMVPLRTLCLERGVSYTLRLEFRRYQDFNSVQDGSGHFILMDSLALMPRHSSLDMFSAGDSSALLRKQTYERYRCHDTARAVVRPVMSEACAKLISSMSALIHQGALECQCDPQGALSSVCDVRGGQCHCRQNVIGRRCDQCAPGTYGFGPSGCSACGCSPSGSLSPLCDPLTGRCPCRLGAFGQRCDRCHGAHWGFPDCKPCLCNGHTEECHHTTGTCQNCRGNTGGERCERCATGFYGNPVLELGGQCRPCPCPEGPASGRHFASSCFQDDRSKQITCNCKQGYTGPRCDQCAPGHHGNPSLPGGRCAPCECHNNIDMSDPGSCDRATGLCLKCLYNTEGRGCGECARGYHGDASRRNCRKCSCNVLGTDSASCGVSGDCGCDRSSGQCLCRPNVLGLSCDHCAPNHWNLMSGRGCAPCDCDPSNAYSAACNEFTGQCQCRSGFGGKTCTDCQENYWGDPRTQCRACDCEWQGISGSQCDRRTGHCACRPGVSGVRCDQCARGFSGVFPNCEPCHQCFGDWDRIVQDLAVRTKALSSRAHELQTTGLTGPYERFFKGLEEKLNLATSIVQARNQTSAAVTLLMELIEELRTQISDTTDWLSRVEAELTVVQDTNTEASSDLSALEREARELNVTSQSLHKQLDLLKNSNFLGAYDSIRGSYQTSRDAERRANESTAATTSGTSSGTTSGTSSAVADSKETRRKTERLIGNKKDEFNRNNAANKRALSNLRERTQGLDLKKINEKVCGAPGDAPCGEGPCGGAGCRDDEGRAFCGGLNCEGAAAVADNALDRSQQAEIQLQRALGDVEGLFQQVREAQVRAQEARGEAQEALDKAFATKRNMERNNNELRELIKDIRLFLTQEGAEPDNIEAVANRVLELSIPASTLQIRHLADEIKERVRSLSNVDAILEQTQGDVRRAEELLLDAKRARHDAEGTKTTAEAVKRALADAHTAQTSAEKTISRARADIQETEGKLTQMESETRGSERALTEAVSRLDALGREINDLKTQRAKNSMSAARAEETATMARDKASEARQMLEGQLTDKFHEAQQRVDTKARLVLEAKGRAEKLRQEAKDLLKDAQGKLRRLAELEQNYDQNQKQLEGKARQLDGLEDKMKTILQDINRQIQIYNTCQARQARIEQPERPGGVLRPADTHHHTHRSLIPHWKKPSSGSENGEGRPVSAKSPKMDASMGGAGGAGGGRAHRFTDHSSSKKKQKDRVNQESREAKRTTAERVIAQVKKDVFMDWKQNASDVIVRLRCGDGVQSAEDVSCSFSDTHALVSFPDGREWCCPLQEEVEASCSRVQFKEKSSLLHVVLHKKIPFHTWSSLMSNKKKDSQKETRGPVEKETRGPVEKETRGPVEKETRGPVEKETRGPVEKETRGPVEKETRGPVQKETRGPEEERKESTACAQKKDQGLSQDQNQSKGTQKGHKAVRKRPPTNKQSKEAVREETEKTSISRADPREESEKSESRAEKEEAVDRRGEKDQKTEATSERTEEPRDNTERSREKAADSSVIRTCAESPLVSEQIPALSMSPVPMEPVSSLSPVPMVPVSSLSPVPMVPVSSLSPVPMVPVSSLSPVPMVPVSSLSPVPMVPVSSLSPLPMVPVSSVPMVPGVPAERSTAPSQAEDCGVQITESQEEMQTSAPPPEGDSGSEQHMDTAPGAEATEEKSDRCKEEEPDTQRQEVPEHMVTLQKLKNDSYEKGTDLMVVNVYVKHLLRETTRVLFRDRDFTLIFQTSDCNFLRLHPGCGPNTVFRWQVKLRNQIDPDQSSYSFTPLRLDVILKKRRSQRWEGLEALAPQGAVGGAKVAVASSTTCLEKNLPGSSQHSLPPTEEPPRGVEDSTKGPKAPARVEETGLDQVTPRSEHMGLKSEAALTTAKPTCMVQPMSHSPSVPDPREEEEERKVCLPGFTGLVNLGNTCFMNSVIQSLSNTRELRDYFHDRAFESEINCNNPLGTGGRLAIGFAVLLRALWKGTHHAFQPSKLKAIVASKASQFTGYAQHDAQEFMAFLLDGLHEDLNRIQNKPYTETVDSDGRLDEVVAEEAWQRHKMRNDSFIVDLFQGQFKSKLVCPTCSKVSITFDPFLYLPVPLPQKQKVLSVFYFSKEPHKRPIKFLVSVSKENSSAAEVLDSISRSVRIKAENLRLAEVCKSRLQRLLLPSQSLDSVSASDLLFCFEVLCRDQSNERLLLLRVHQKLQVPNLPISKCSSCLKQSASEDDKLKRCTRCYRVGYCNQACQKSHWPHHKAQCRPHSELVGLPFLISVPESRLTYSRLSQLLQGYSRFSVDVFQPPFQSGRLSPETRCDLPLLSGPSEGSEDEGQSEGARGGERVEMGEEGGDCAQASETPQTPVTTPTDHDSGISELGSCCSSDLQTEKETTCEKSVRPEAAVTGYQQSSECVSGHSQFYISVLDNNNKEQKLEEREDGLLDLTEDMSLELVWKNNERLKEYVLVSSKELEYDDDPGSLSETSRAGHFSLEQCLNLFTRPEVLAPEEAWYCPKCQQHREASKQLLLWRLPNVLIIQLKRFSFRTFIWRDKINDMVDFPVRNLDLSEFCIGQKDDLQQPPVYDLYAVINHYGGMIGGHYTAYARLPSDRGSQRSDVGWRLFDDSTVTMVEESQVVTRYAYVLFYRRRNSPVERPPRVPRPLGAESSTAAGAAANQASLIWRELEEDESLRRRVRGRTQRVPGGRGDQWVHRDHQDHRDIRDHRDQTLSQNQDDDWSRYVLLVTATAAIALVFNMVYALVYRV